MSEFIIRTNDNQYTYTSTIPVGIVFNISNNITSSDTQGFLRKVQKGQDRYSVDVILKVTADDLEDIFIPMLSYNDDVYVTFDRNICGRGIDSGTFTFEDMQIKQEFRTGNDYEYEITLKLVEVIYN
jgi:hypothetical protein